MAEIMINKLGPIEHCELSIDEFMVFTGPQSSGKSTIAKSVFYFKSVRNVIMQLLRRQHVYSEERMDLSLKNRLIRELRSNFLQTFGSTWCMDKNMCIRYEYTEDVFIQISLHDDPMSPNYIWVTISPELTAFLDHLDVDSSAGDMIADLEFQDAMRQYINEFFDDDNEIVYIPAGRSMITLLSTQLSYVYSMMDDTQRRSIDYCTQNYLERILKMKPYFSVSLEQLVKNQKELTDQKIDIDVVQQAIQLITKILRGEYRNIEGEERLQLDSRCYVKINFASSGQQEAVWILNVLFYYLVHGEKTYFIVEEPESHLYPDAQKLITEFIALVKNAGNQIMLTTHSPYILGTLNNLLYANKISSQVHKERLHQIISREEWLNFQNFASYYVKDGACVPCMDEEFQAIENGVIDGASEDINRDFNSMLELRE